VTLEIIIFITDFPLSAAYYTETYRAPAFTATTVSPARPESISFRKRITGSGKSRRRSRKRPLFEVKKKRKELH
jgi:hypothetical protein